jgi:hypothetical protein
MSFGLKVLKKRHDGLKSESACVHIPQVVIGYDVAAVLKVLELRKTLAPEQLRLVTPHLITRERLLDSYQHVVSRWRDNAVTLSASAKFPCVKSHRIDHESLFFKEGQWHKFAGRAKPMDLQPGEAFFQAPRQDVPLAGFFAPDDWENLDAILHSYQSVRVLENLTKTTPTDLVSPAEWTMLFHDLGEVTCAELWLSLPARLVLKATHQGQTLPPELAAHLAGVRRQAAVNLHWEFSKEIHPQARTLFVPQSMTHEWGHFIVDVHAWNGRSQQMDVLILLHEEEPTTEGMADKIKLAKRVLDRAFPGFEKSLTSEHIVASEDFFEMSDAQPALQHVPGLHLLGAYAVGQAHFCYSPNHLLI